MFRTSWHNFLIFGFSWVFTGISLGLYYAWASLFELVGIDIFQEVFENQWLFLWVNSILFASAVGLLRSKADIVHSFAGMIHFLCKYILVFLAAMYLLFLAVLPFVGLDAMWDAGGSKLLIPMAFCVLFFVNASYRYDSLANSPYSLFLNRMIGLAVLLLPFFSFISLYGLGLRIDQYGWNVDRYWGVFVNVALLGVALPYSYGIIRLKERWVSLFPQINIYFGLGLLVALLLVSSPLMDFKKWTISSQLARVSSGEIAPEGLDVEYFLRQLGNPGKEAIKALQLEYQESHPEFAEYLADCLENGPYECAMNEQETFKMPERIFAAYPFSYEYMSKELRIHFEDLVKDVKIPHPQSTFFGEGYWDNIEKILVLPYDLKVGGNYEYILFFIIGEPGASSRHGDENWAKEGSLNGSQTVRRIPIKILFEENGVVTLAEPKQGSEPKPFIEATNTELYEWIETQNYGSEPKPWRIFRIDDETFQVGD